MSNEFAKKFWREFERLTLEIIQKYYDIYDDKVVYSTPAQKDGGYDGIIIVNNVDNDILKEYRILIEAKLRKNSNKDIPLAGFSKIFIIAINMFADKVYISTNLHYSKKTQENTKYFSERTGLRVELIDIFTIQKMLEEHPDIASQFNHTFIHELLTAVSLHPLDRHIETSNNDTFNTLPEMIGKTRREILSGRLNAMKHNHGIMIIYGEKGCGKTLFLKHLLYQSFRSHIPSHTLSLKDFLTAKEFFINLLAAIWNVPVLEIYSLTNEDIENIICYISDKNISKKARNILQKILIEDTTKYENRIDVWHDHLIQYLFEIYTPILKRKKQILAFTDVHNSDITILNFLNKFIRKFHDSNLIIILESRVIDYDNNWNLYMKKIETLADDIPSVYLSRLSLPDCEEYIHKKAPQYNDSEIFAIASVCLPIPIYIDNLLQIINDDAEFERLFKSPDLNIKALFENDKFKERLITHSFSLFIKQVCKEAKFLSYIVGLMDGQVPIDSLYLLKDINLEKGMDELLNSIYFTEENNILKVQHLMYFDAIKNGNYLSAFDLKYILQLVLINMDKFIIDAFSKKIKGLQIAIKLNRKDLIESNWKDIIASLLKNDEYKLSNELLIDIYSLIYSTLSLTDKFILTLNFIKIYIGQNQYSSKDLKKYILKCEELLFHFEDNEKNSAYKNEFLYLKSKFLLATGKYSEILEMSNIYDFIEIRYMRALAVKHLHGIDACIKTLERGIKRFPQSWLLKYSFYDHKAADLGGYYFQESLDYLNNILALWENLNLEEQLHWQYNRITLLFYLRDKMVENECSKICNYAFQNGILVEEGRCHNLLGQIEWVNKNYKAAYKEFKTAYNLQFQSFHATNIWIALANLSLLSFECADKPESIYYAETSIKHILEYNYQLIVQAPSVDNLLDCKHKMPKPYITLLLLSRNIYLLENHSQFLKDNIEIIPSANLQKDLHKYAYPNKMKEILSGTHFYLQGHYMIRS